ncbi:hypothetical protein AS888_12120 [Peribacillus simplex]|uniref:Uncharacterized protein n=1 Tax=Peribacillus simplex TaxID=1478 RepID=A0A109N304_9BACI|nr:hypothetical protein AS888_12120 [Peribacillus simplex]
MPAGAAGQVRVPQGVHVEGLHRTSSWSWSWYGADSKAQEDESHHKSLSSYNTVRENTAKKEK